MRQMSLLLVFCLLGVPLHTAAQSSQIPQTSSPANSSCRGTKVHVRVKLKNGKTVTGDLLEQSAQSATLCADGVSQSFDASEIKGISSRMTPRQRLRHTLKVMGFEAVGVVIFAIIVVANAPK